MRSFGISILLFSASVVSFGQTMEPDNTLIADTIDFGNKRLTLAMPQISVEKSQFFNFNGEGVAYHFPLFTGKCIIPGLCFTYIANNRNNLLNTDIFDTELWNTLNSNLVGSRCFVKNNLYTRIDHYYNGLTIYYMDLPKEMAERANAIMKSICIKQKQPNDTPLQEHKRIKGVVEQ